VKALLALLALVAGTAAAATLDEQLATVETLVERSSAARQVETSGVPQALSGRERAREALRAAKQAASAGDSAQAEQQLVEARRQMIAAVRLASADRLTAEKAQADFERRLESARALLDAQRRVSAEKGKGAEALRTAEQKMDVALKLRAEGRMSAALGELEQAYLIAKASLGSLRQGDTLVRSLNFASKEEEYRYELDRNDTHQMLLRVLLDGKRETASGDSVATYVERARGLRVRAEDAARRGDHAAAVRDLEDATTELVKAIRGAGVYIPG